MKGQSVQWGVAIVLSLWSLTNAVSQSAPIVLDITPYHGSINGATRLTIKGQGFLGERPFDYTGGNGQLGNKVQLLSESRSIPCDVEKDFSHDTQIICYTRPLPKDSYQVVVSVDGVPINSIKMLIFKSEDHYTPTIEKISPSSGLPGQLINISGDIFTDIYGSNKPVDSTLRRTRILSCRVYAGGMLCELLHPESDMFYGLKLDNVYSDSGTMTCKMTGTYVGHHNVSFILDNGHGRSLPNPNTYFISSLNKLSMFQTYADIPMIAYPPLFDKGILIEDIIVTEGGTKNAGVHSQYEVTMVTIDCSCNIPMLEIAFAQPLPNSTKDEIVYRGSTWPDGSILRVWRTQAASSPISGTLDIEYFGKTLKDLPVNVTALEMQYALQTIPEIGTVSVMNSGNCSAAQWTVKWLSKPGNQPKLKINDVNVIGVNATVNVYNKQRGGLFSEHLMGDLFRTPHTQPQVEVFINGIPSNCSGNCGYEWNAEKTPAISHITPTTGSRTGGTVLTIRGFRFANSSTTDTTWVSIGGTHCPITGLTDTEITCTIAVASNTSSPLIVYIAGLGFANYSSNQTYTFTFQFEATSIYPSTGSTEGGTILTISGYGFVPNSTVLIGGKTCLELTESPVKMKCSTPAAPVGMYNISVIAAGISNPVPFSFIYIDAKIPVILEVIPRTSSVSGGSNLTIYGSDFGNKTEDSFVVIGNSECAILRWSTNNITCCLPSLPPANYSIYVQTLVGKSLNASIEYILRVMEVSLQQGSLYGGTKITISGSGFSPVPEDNVVQIGSVPCHIAFASPNILECVSDQTGRKFVINNNGSSQTFGVGYKWNPSNLDIFVGDTVQWQWKAPSLLQNLKYRVSSVSKPSDVNYKGIGFISGNMSTTSGSFSHHFTSPGTYYYSSGYVDQKQSIILQGVVNVKPTEESIKGVQVYLAGIEAEYIPGPSEKLHSQLKSNSDCTVPKPTCNQASNKTDDRSFTFHLSLCCSPTINSIAPSKGTMKDRLTITGTGFSNISCANEVRVGAHRCVVENSTESELLCQIDPEGVMDIGIAVLVSVTIQNLGTAINTLTDELSRRFVLLPHIDAVNPNVGSTMGKTRVTITGSGFGADLGAVTVQLANVFCMLVSGNYTHVICDSSASIVSIGIVTLSIHGIPAVCSGACDYSYAENAAPILLNVSSMFLTTVYTQLTISGSGFGNRVDEAFILIGDASFVPSDVSDSSMNCTVGPVPVGKHTLRVLTLNKGLSLRGIPITNAARASLSPASGGIHGGTTLLITGNGFVQDETIVTVHRSPCHLLSVTPGEVKCIVPAGPPGTVDVKTIVHSTMYPVLRFTYNQTKTPKILAVSPATGVSESTVTIVGSGFGSAATDITVFIDNVLCNVILMNESCVQCIVGHHAGGIFPIFLKNKRWGYASTDFSFQYELNITSIFPTEGNFGGGTLLTIRGIGFDQQKSQVFVCHNECKKVPSASTSRNLYCQVPLHNGTEPQLACEVVVVNGNVSSKVSNGFTYSLALISVIATISPRRGGTGGGTKLTITGSGFSSDISENNVTIAESPCEIQSVNETNILCVTSAHFPSQQTKVIVSVQGNGIAKLDNADFNYIDVWSSRYTWGGDTPPETGSLVVITKGQTVLLDQSTPVLKTLVLQGGTLLFDDADIELQTENILVTDGGVFQIGTESAPFRHKAIITLHGHLRAKELPLYGAKTLAVREGTLDLHVVHGCFSSCASAAFPSHGHSQRENEDRIIDAVSDDGRILNLTEPLTYQHLGVSIPLPDGIVFEARAEVGLLTRNIVIRGSNHIEWNDQIEACPDGFDTGEFATQTCFQGRFDEEIGSDQFGGCIMFHNPQPSKDLVVGRLEYVEIYYAGQAFRLGRYPIHWHLMGDLRYESYVRGCAIHQTFNRAVTIHGTHHLLVEGNVAYNIMGGAFFIALFNAILNVLQYNLAVMVQQSTSLLNDDLTPAAFWVTNPSNIIRHNVAAGGTHFGFWYRLLEHPDGPSYTPDVCPRNLPLGQFLNNTVHSQGWFGLWIFKTYHPQKGGQCNSLISWERKEPAMVELCQIHSTEAGHLAHLTRAGVYAARNPGNKVLPHSSLLDPARCHPSVEWSHEYPGVVCDATITIHRLTLSQPSPFALKEKKLILSNSHGTSVIPYWSAHGINNGGWMALIPNDEILNWHFKDMGFLTSISYKATFHHFKDNDSIVMSHKFIHQPNYFKIMNPVRNNSLQPLSWASNQNGDWYFDQDNLTLYYLKRNLCHSQKHFLSRTWSNSSFWESRPESNHTVPTEGSSVLIKQGLVQTVSGFLAALLLMLFVLQGGRLIAGSPEKPFQGELQIVLKGDHSTPDWSFKNGPNQGSKVLGVFGGLDLHGIPHLVYKTKLGSTAHADSLNITLAEAVDWQEGDEILVSTTSYNHMQTEIRMIHSISFDRKTLGLNKALSHTHIAETQELKERGQSYTLAADIGLLSRNIKIIGHHHPDKANEMFGARVLISSFFHNGVEFKGHARIQDVEFYHSGQYGYLSYFDPRYSVSFLNLGEIVENDSYIRGCSFHHGFAPAIGVLETNGLDINDNVICKTSNGGIILMGNRNRARRNLVALSLWSSVSDTWTAAIEVAQGTNIVLQGNIVAGFEKAGYRINGEPGPGKSQPQRHLHSTRISHLCDIDIIPLGPGKQPALVSCKLQFSDLKEISSNLGEAMLTGNLSASLGFTISTIDLSSPVPPPGDAQWVQMTSKPVLSRAVRTNHVATVTGLIIVREPVAGQTGQLLSQQPSVKAVDDAGNCVSVGVTSWELVAVLLNSQNMTVSGLNGTTSILFAGCWANYTDLSINTNGTGYKLLFELKSIKTHSGTFSVKQINDSPGKPSGTSPASVLGNTQGIISGSIMGSVVLIRLIAGIIWKLTAGNTKKIQVSTRPDAQDKKQVDTVTGYNPDNSLPRVQN
ncbi:fibrocystin-L-like [Rhincodon typus]|uniref:fibrocystin-L-like n=1 Tax=Rhincodon typus TaxID=259920 RepID=UPI00202E0A3E|nr:fibrocystin-L-like [Rhincodon typus]